MLARAFGATTAAYRRSDTASRSTGPTISMIVSKDTDLDGLEHGFSPWLMRLRPP